MKKFMTGAMSVILLASAAAPAFAQRDGGWRNGDPRNSGGHARYGARVNEAPAPQAQPAPQAAPPVAAAPAQGRRGGENRSDGRGWNRNDPTNSRLYGGERNAAAPGNEGARSRWNGQRSGGGERTWNREGRDRNWDQNRNVERGRNWDQNRNVDRNRDWDRNRNWTGERNWNGGGRDRDRERPRYDRRHYPPTYHADRRFRGGVYRAPYGFYNRSWVYGDILPRGWYGPDYSLNSWWDYGLPVPPVGYEWIRVGDDALLVDTFTGRVVQVVYDLFW